MLVSHQHIVCVPHLRDDVKNRATICIKLQNRQEQAGHAAVPGEGGPIWALVMARSPACHARQDTEVINQLVAE